MKNINDVNKKEARTLNVVLLVVGISAFIFTAVMMVFFAIFQQIPDTLCERFYTCVVGECGIAGVIQVVKTIFQNKQSQHINSDADVDVDDTYTSDDINNLET